MNIFNNVNPFLLFLLRIIWEKSKICMSWKLEKNLMNEFVTYDHWALIQCFSCILVRVYKCRYMVAYCGQCLSMDSKYNCGWCQGPCDTSGKCDGTCSLSKECAGGTSSNGVSRWLDRSATCPNPKITRVCTYDFSASCPFLFVISVCLSVCLSISLPPLFLFHYLPCLNPYFLILEA